MGSKRIGQVRFQAISGDHPSGAHPHLHALIGSGEVVIELARGIARLSRAHRQAIRGHVTRSEVRLVLDTATSAYDDLLALWKDSQDA